MPVLVNFDYVPRQPSIYMHVLSFIPMLPFFWTGVFHKTPMCFKASNLVPSNHDSFGQSQDLKFCLPKEAQAWNEIEAVIWLEYCQSEIRVSFTVNLSIPEVAPFSRMTS